MKAMRCHPNLYEINALVFANRLSRKYEKSLSISEIPETEWRFLKEQGIDLVWLMGVWQRSAGARECALREPALRRDYDVTLPGWKACDVAGSPYAIYSYTLDSKLGVAREIASLRKKLNNQGLRLILDFVPNHLALDHPWTLSDPARFVQGDERTFRQRPGWFFKTKKNAYLAHGRDPYFPPWSDTVQVNFFSKDMRRALVKELLQIAKVSDGVRCDMAMLGLNEVFAAVWGKFLSGSEKQPQPEFWQEAIQKVKNHFPEFIFIAESYWDLEWKLQQLGFDYTYDGKLYRRLFHSTAKEVNGHLHAELAYQNKSVRFIENHDELRAKIAFGPERSRAAAIVIATIPGLHFFHDGQWEGKTIRLPIQLIRNQEEKVDEPTSEFYRRFLSYINAEVFHEGRWRLLEAAPVSEGNDSCKNILCWLWMRRRDLRLIVVNYSAFQSQARIRLPIALKQKEQLVFKDHLMDAIYQRDDSELSSQGFYVDLGPWCAHLLELV